MEYWEHMTITREIIKGRDSPVTRRGTRERNIRQDKNVEKQVSKGQPPHIEEQNRNKVGILQRRERTHEIGRKL